MYVKIETFTFCDTNEKVNKENQDQGKKSNKGQEIEIKTETFAERSENGRQWWILYYIHNYKVVSDIFI